MWLSAWLAPTRAITGSGFGKYGVYSTLLLGSTDVTVHVVNKVPAAQRVVDHGHAGLSLANDA